MNKIHILTVFTLSILFTFQISAQCPPASGGDFDGDLIITGTCVVNGDLNLKKKNLTITSTGSLTVNGTFNNDGNGNVSIDGGTFIVTTAFNNTGNGVITVDGGATLDVGTDYFNNGNGTTNFLDGTVLIGGNYENDGNGNIAAGGLVTIGGDFTVSGNGTNTVSGGLNIGGTADLGSGGIDIADGGVLQVDEIISAGDIDIAAGGTISVVSGNITGTVNNDPANADQDCTNNCCGDLCNTSGDALSGTGSGVLPIELLYFETQRTNQSILIEWASANEINNDFYTLEKSFDGVVFEEIGKIKGAGNSETIKKYKFSDVVNFRGFVYYRLSQTDFDGTKETFKLSSILVDGFQNVNQLIYPTALRAGQKVTIVNSRGENCRDGNSDCQCQWKSYQATNSNFKQYIPSDRWLGSWSLLFKGTH